MNKKYRKTVNPKCKTGHAAPPETNMIVRPDRDRFSGWSVPCWC